MKSPSINLMAQIIETFSLAAQQNSYPFLRNLRLKYCTDSEICEEFLLAPLHHVEVTLFSVPRVFEEEKWTFDKIQAGDVLSLQLPKMTLLYDFLENTNEEVKVELRFEITWRGMKNKPIVHNYSVSVLPKNYWGGARQPELLAAFVRPNSPYINGLVKASSDLLFNQEMPSAIDGYASRTKEKPYRFAQALCPSYVNKKSPM